MLPVAVTGIRAEWQSNRLAQSKTGANHSATRASAMKTAWVPPCRAGRFSIKRVLGNPTWLGGDIHRSRCSLVCRMVRHSSLVSIQASGVLAAAIYLHQLGPIAHGFRCLACGHSIDVLKKPPLVR